MWMMETPWTSSAIGAPPTRLLPTCCCIHGLGARGAVEFTYLFSCILHSILRLVLLADARDSGILRPKDSEFSRTSTAESSRQPSVATMLTMAKGHVGDILWMRKCCGWTLWWSRFPIAWPRGRARDPGNPTENSDCR